MLIFMLILLPFFNKCFMIYPKNIYYFKAFSFKKSYNKKKRNNNLGYKNVLI